MKSRNRCAPSCPNLVYTYWELLYCRNIYIYKMHLAYLLCLRQFSDQVPWHCYPDALKAFKFPFYLFFLFFWPSYLGCIYLKWTLSNFQVCKISVLSNCTFFAFSVWFAFAMQQSKWNAFFLYSVDLFMRFYWIVNWMQTWFIWQVSPIHWLWKEELRKRCFNSAITVSSFLLFPSNKLSIQSDIPFNWKIN